MSLCYYRCLQKELLIVARKIIANVGKTAPKRYKKTKSKHLKQKCWKTTKPAYNDPTISYSQQYILHTVSIYCGNGTQQFTPLFPSLFLLIYSIFIPHLLSYIATYNFAGRDFPYQTYQTEIYQCLNYNNRGSSVQSWHELNEPDAMSLSNVFLFLLLTYRWQETTVCVYLFCYWEKEQVRILFYDICCRYSQPPVRGLESKSQQITKQSQIYARCKRLIGFLLYMLYLNFHFIAQRQFSQFYGTTAKQHRATLCFNYIYNCVFPFTVKHVFFRVGVSSKQFLLHLF